MKIKVYIQKIVHEKNSAKQRKEYSHDKSVPLNLQRGAESRYMKWSEIRDDGGGIVSTLSNGIPAA